jgi:hypothetical protein
LSLATYASLFVLAAISLFIGVGWLAFAFILLAFIFAIADVASPKTAPAKQEKTAAAAQPQGPPPMPPANPGWAIISGLMGTVATDWFTSSEEYQEALKKHRKREKTEFLNPPEAPKKGEKTTKDVVKALEKIEKKVEKIAEGHDDKAKKKKK